MSASTWTPNAVANALLRLAVGLFLLGTLAIGGLWLIATHAERQSAEERSRNEKESLQETLNKYKIEPDKRDFILDRVPYVR